MNICLKRKKQIRMPVGSHISLRYGFKTFDIIKSLELVLRFFKKDKLSLNIYNTQVD